MAWEPTEEQRAALEQQTYVEELMKLRLGRQNAAAAEAQAHKPAWQRLLESAGGAALVTVVLGTLGGALLTGMIQTWNQQQQTRLLSFSEYLKGEHDVVESAFALIGQGIAVSDNLNVITTSGFNPNLFEGEQRTAVLGQKKNLRDEFNKVDEQWRATRETLTLNMRYYHGNQGALSNAWDKTRDDLSSYMDCQHRWYAEHMGNFVDDMVAAKACSGERASLEDALRKLSAALEENRIYQWKEPKSH